MMSSAYLDVLDDLLRPGIDGLSVQFVHTQVRFVAGCQQSDGGFVGRQGGSDPYYTDFALRTLAWLAPNNVGFGRAAGYLAHLPCVPRDTVECFNILNARRLLERHSAAVTDDSAMADLPYNLKPGGKAAGALDPLVVTEWLQRGLLPTGGFARSADDARVSAYHTFLAALCFQMLRVDIPAIDNAIDAIESLRRSDGGYVELAGQTASQTSATAAAVAFLMMHDAMMPDKVAGTAQFLAKMQSADGGLRPHTASPCGDLLSTFTGLLTLFSLGKLDHIDTTGVARFLRSTAQPGGGFVACNGDDSPDVEYTYYAVGTLALLHLLKHTYA